MESESLPHSQRQFSEQTEPYRHELRVHCYRMLGSLTDAEDLVQETYLRAWKRYRQSTEPHLFRPWLYKIATNACLDLLRQRKRRALMQPDVPMATGLPSHLSVDEAAWIEPLPSAFIPNVASNPEAVYSIRESVSLAFMALLHKLPPQHRAVLILRDVLGWKAREVATQLEMSVSAVNSATLRARQGMQRPNEKQTVAPEVAQTYVANYVAAWEAGDVNNLVSLLTHDVVMNMPPLPIWFGGLPPITGFLAHIAFAGSPEQWKLQPVGVNGQVGVGIYQLQPERRRYHFFGVHALVVEPAGITRIDHFMAGDAPFLDKPIVASWAAYFDLPTELKASS